MKTLIPFIAALAMLSGCALPPTKSQLVTLSSTLKAAPEKGFVYETDTLRLSYQFFSEGGTVHFSIENKLATPLYIDWKRSSFIIGQKKLDYWYDASSVNLTGTAYTSGYGRYLRSSSSTSVNLTGSINKENAVDFIPPGTKIEKDQFVLVPGPALVLRGQYLTEKVASTDSSRRKPVDVQTYQYTVDTSPLQFRNYLTLSTDKDFRSEFALDNKFWASGVKVMPFQQLTGGNFYDYESKNNDLSTLKSFPYFRSDAFFIPYSLSSYSSASTLDPAPR